MAHKKRQKYNPFLSRKDLEHVPLAFRFMTRVRTEDIGEMYKYVRFSQAKAFQTYSLNNYMEQTPISPLQINKDDV